MNAKGTGVLELIGAICLLIGGVIFGFMPDDEGCQFALENARQYAEDSVTFSGASISCTGEDCRIINRAGFELEVSCSCEDNGRCWQ